MSERRPWWISCSSSESAKSRKLHLVLCRTGTVSILVRSDNHFMEAAGFPCDSTAAGCSCKRKIKNKKEKEKQNNCSWGGWHTPKISVLGLGLEGCEFKVSLGV